MESAIKRLRLYDGRGSLLDDGPSRSSRSAVRRDARRRRSSRSRSTVSPVSVPEGTTILVGLRDIGVTIPTLCFLETLRPVNVCRLCVVEVEGARVLAPSCSRAVEAGMVVHTRSPRVMHVAQARARAARLVGRFVDRAGHGGVADGYECEPERFGRRAASDARERAIAGHHEPPPINAATVAQPVKIDNDLYIRDYGKCVLCYKCVEACGSDHQNTFAIAVAGRGFDARISHRVRGAAAGLRLRLLRQLHRRVSDRRADGQPRVRAARGRRVGRGAADRDGHDLPVLRRRLHADACTCRMARSSRRRRHSTTPSPRATCASRAGSAGGS